MRKLIISSAVVMAMGSVAAQAAQTATLSVIGSIEPAACDVTLSTASVNFGTIAASELTTDVTEKIADPVTVNLACDAATAVAVQTTDNRSASAMTTAEITSDMNFDASGISDSIIFGLGTDTASNKIGVLVLGVAAATLDGVTSTNLLTSSDKATWTASSLSGGIYSIVKNGYIALADSAESTSPVTLTNATYSLTPAIMLKKAGKYPSGETVTFDGNVTFSVVYL